MNTRLSKLAGRLERLGVVLTLWAAARADGGMTFWLPLTLCGMVLCLTGMGLHWLCSQAGKDWRRSRFGSRAALPLPRDAAPVILAFPKAG